MNWLLDASRYFRRLGELHEPPKQGGGYVVWELKPFNPSGQVVHRYDLQDPVGKTR
jgi:hypothetical protein